jgi:hypothetical protein
LDGKKIVGAGFSFVRHTKDNETVLSPLANEQEEFERLRERSLALGTHLKTRRDEVIFLEKK